MNQDKMIGKKFGRLTVIEKTPNIYNKNKYLKYWVCQCDCGNTTIVEGSKLRRGHTQSCGCLQRERTSKARRKVNNYSFFEKTIYIYNDKQQYTKIDAEDFDKIKEFYWSKNRNGYWSAFDLKRGRGYVVNLHDIILFGTEYYNIVSTDKMCDHIDGDRSNNKKNNLRVVTKEENNRNLGIRKDNTSGNIGIHFNKTLKKWETYINFDKKRYHLGFFKNKEEAILNRMIAQYILFKQYSRQNCVEEIKKLNVSSEMKIKALDRVYKKLEKEGVQMDNIKDYEIWLYGEDYHTHSTK